MRGRNYCETGNKWTLLLKAAYPLVPRLTVSSGHYVTENGLYKPRVEGEKASVMTSELTNVVKKVEAEMEMKLDKLASALYHVVTDLPEAAVHLFDSSPEMAREWSRKDVQENLYALLIRMLGVAEAQEGIASGKGRSRTERFSVVVELDSDSDHSRTCNIQLRRFRPSDRPDLRFSTEYPLLALLHIERLRAILCMVVESTKKVDEMP